MPRRAISVTLETDNVTWLKGRAGASGESVSELLDQIVSAARHGGGARHVRSVVGTVRINDSDPMLDHADEAIRSLFESALRQPTFVREQRPPYRATPQRRKNSRSKRG